MEIKEFLLEPQEKTDLCKSFIYQPSNIEEEKLGWLLMAGKIKDLPESSFYLLNLLASRMKREYFSNLKRGPSKSFEMALKVAREVLKENEKRINWLLNLDFLVAAVLPKKLYFSYIGKMESLIIRTGKENEILDLTKKMVSEKNILFPFSIFVETKLEKNDVLIFATKNLLLKEKLLKMGSEIFPFKEEKMKNAFEIKEGAMILTLNRKKPPSLISKKFKKIQKLPQKSFEIKKKIEKEFSFFSQNLKNLAIKIKNLKKIQDFKFLKIAFLFLAILSLLLGSSIFLEKRKHDFLEKIKLIQNLKSKAENSINFGKENEAIFYLKEALKMIESAKQKAPKKETEKINDLERKIENKLGFLFKKEVIENPEFLFEIKKNVQRWMPQKIIATEKEIYLLNPSSNLVFRWNPFSKEGIFLPIEIEGAEDATLIEENPIFFNKKGEISLIGKKINLKPKIKLEDPIISSFRKYFYLLERKSGEILKFKFEKEKEMIEGDLWFKEKNKGKNAKSFAIDGNIYLLFDKKIKIFFQGREKGLINLPGAYPPIKNLEKIFTSEKNKYLYLFEPKQKRIILLTKDGKKEKEYFLPKLEEPKDFWVLPDDKTIYLLDKNKVFLIKLK